jgi:hypothetical protein
VISLPTWAAALLGVALTTVSVLLVIWWRQQTFRWPIVLIICLMLAPALSWWSGQAFEVPDYRAGCDGLCPGFRGAPLPIYGGESAGDAFMPVMFALNSLVYLVLLLGWSAIARGLLRRVAAHAQRREWLVALLGIALWLGPLLLAPFYLPPPEARVRGDPLRIAINGRREIFMYAGQAALPIWRTGLEDVRPRSDGRPGMRVCLRTYSFFYWPTGHIYLDMAPEGVHSNGGGVLPLDDSCWSQPAH